MASFKATTEQELASELTSISDNAKKLEKAVGLTSQNSTTLHALAEQITKSTKRLDGEIAQLGGAVASIENTVSPINYAREQVSDASTNLQHASESATT